ncbi:DUF2141 domain-containing protein [Rhizosaccharibacter radicis]|uniref:DUF2141 domain-containing protein n=1 Tax=Rhizosaccharibacter radicis TaxID=2782605 RepID=A0ABT1VZD4_9PROT|nr:DUF2141 domain-containing protein [Acetobacteraceae bacterium KSS12]
MTALRGRRAAGAIVLGGILAAAVPAAAGLAATLTVTVRGVPDDKGHVRIGVCTPATFLSEHCEYHAFVPSRAGNVTAAIHDIPPGTYAVAAFQDVDDDTHLHRNFFGKPTEPLGFSRDPVLHLHPPKFANCAVRIGPGDGVLSLALRQY